MLRRWNVRGVAVTGYFVAVTYRDSTLFDGELEVGPDRLAWVSVGRSPMRHGWRPLLTLPRPVVHEGAEVLMSRSRLIPGRIVLTVRGAVDAPEPGPAEVALWGRRARDVLAHLEACGFRTQKRLIWLWRGSQRQRRRVR